MSGSPAGLEATRGDQGARVVGVDVARCVALLGMMATHILPAFVDGQVPEVDQVASGRASALFATLAGTSLVLAYARRSLRLDRRFGGVLAAVTVRAVLLGFLGLLLGEVESGIAVILTYYGLLFLVGMWFLPLSARWLFVVAGCWLVLGPQLSHALRGQVEPFGYQVPSLESLEAPTMLLRELFLTGYYPVLTWMPYLLLGMAVGKLDLRAPRVWAGLAAAGASAMLVAALVSDWFTSRSQVRAALVESFEGAGWRGSLDVTLSSGLLGVTPTGSPWWLVVRAPHSGTSFDLLMTAGSAVLVLAVCLLVASAVPRVMRVVFGAGAMTLTLYSLHVLVRREGLWDGRDTETFLGQAGAALLIGAAYAALGRRGPLERLVGAASAGASRVVDPRG